MVHFYVIKRKKFKTAIYTSSQGQKKLYNNVWSLIDIFTSIYVFNLIYNNVMKFCFSFFSASFFNMCGVTNWTREHAIMSRLERVYDAGLLHLHPFDHVIVNMYDFCFYIHEVWSIVPNMEQLTIFAAYIMYL